MTVDKEPVMKKQPFTRDFLNARREAWIILVSWAICLAWTVGYCSVYAYDVAVEDLSEVLGMPGWVVWGVLVPWLSATAFSTWFGLVYMTDDDLGQVEPPGSGKESESGGSSE